MHSIRLTKIIDGPIDNTLPRKVRHLFSIVITHRLIEFMFAKGLVTNLQMAQYLADNRLLPSEIR